MCRNWELTNECRFGDTCAFAHGDHELQKKRHVPSKYKTRLCKQFHVALYCPYGQRCQFVHSLRERGLSASKYWRNDKIIGELKQATESTKSKK